jgi:DNA repair protein RAD16
VNAGTVLNNYAHIFDILIRLRQVVDHPYLVLFGKHSSENANGPQLNDATEVLCGLCHETPTDARQSRCHHVFCQGCICDFLQIESADTAALCPLCSSPLSIDLEQSEDPHSNEVWGRGAKLGRRNFLRHINVERFQSSTKLEALMQVSTRTWRPI